MHPFCLLLAVSIYEAAGDMHHSNFGTRGEGPDEEHFDVPNSQESSMWLGRDSVDRRRVGRSCLTLSSPHSFFLQNFTSTSTMHQQYPSLTSSYSYRRALPSAVAVSVKTTFENNAILALTRIGRVSSSTLLNDERFMPYFATSLIMTSDICHYLLFQHQLLHLSLRTRHWSILRAKTRKRNPLTIM
jgi:hypothetical protein